LNSPFCESIIIPPTEINIPIEEVDTPNDAGPLEGCNLGNGTADFDLTTLNNLINGGNGTMVNWYENIDLTGQIGIPSNYNSSSDFVYATLIDGACESDPVEIELIVLDELTYFLSGDLTLCPGQCEDVTFILEGGSGSYNLDVTITFLGIPINIPMGGVMSGVKITFCYGGSGFLPSYDAGSMTLTIPSSIQLSGSLSIDDMSDFNDPFCDGVSGGQSTAVIDLMEGPEAGDPDGLILCDEGGGFATFDLSPTESQILNGNTGSVIYYSDATLTNEISSPYYTSSTTIYAVIDDNGCLSDPVELELSVINNGDVGLVYLSCEENQPTTLCTICDTDGVAGELFTIFFNTQNPGLYNLIVEYVIDGTPTIATYNDFNAPGELDEFNITQVSTFTLISVEQIGVGCPDDTDLGDPVVITYGLQPDLDPLGPLNDCESVTLPIITGSNYSVAPLYYTQPLGGGTIYNAGDVISSSTVLYIFSGTTDCYDEETVIINIGGTTTYDQPGNIVQCGSYTLPPITGENVGNNTLYFTDPDGAGVSYEPGDEINLSNTNGTITLFIFDFVSTCATNQPFFSITITEAPEFTNENFVNGCSSFTLPMITGSNLSGSEYYSDQTGGLGNIINPGEIVSVNDTIYLYDESNGCITIDSVIINIEYPLNVGIDAIVTYCEGYDSPIDLMDLLGGTPAVGGIWDDESGTGISLVDSTSVNISSLAVGLYDFSYSGVSMICNNNSSSVFIEILPDVTAGLDSISNFCSSTMSVFDLNTFLIENTSQGIFINSNGDTILTPENLDLSNQMGLFEYYYITTDPNQCSQDTALVSISLQESNDAGEDVSTAICVGSQVDLSEILENNNATGLFEDNDATGGLIGNIFNSTGLAEDTYQFNHILPASNSCLADTSIINVVVSATVSAGITDSLQICFGDNVNLLTGLIGEDNGGVFFVENMVGVVPSIFNSTNTGIGEYNFIYVVGDNVTCPQDTSIVYVNVNELPELDFSITKNTICEGDSSFISLLNIANRNTFFDINVFKDNSLILTSIGYSDGLIPGFDIIVDEQNTVSIGNKKLLLDEFDVNYSIQFTNIENGSCFLDTIIEFDFTPISSITFDFNSSICSGQSIMVGNDVYDENNLSGTSMLQSVNGCDSIVNVNLQLSDQVYGPDYIRTTCDDNQVFVVFGETFDINNSYGEIVLQGASQAGCDSIIVVEIFYESDKQGPDYNEFTCDENYEITIGNEVFNVSNPSGIAILSGMASNGCDSSFIVNIDFLNDISGSFNFTTCDPTYNIEIGGIIFDVNNSLGTALLPGQASNGCDSIVDVELSFRNEVNENIFVTTCNEGFSLTIEGETFDMNTPQGEVTLENGSFEGCDSTIAVNINFVPFEIDFEVYNEGCNEDLGGIYINGSSVNSPLTYEINGISATSSLPELPKLIELAEGDYTLNVSNPDGCSQSYAVTIEPNPSSYGSTINSTVISKNSYQLALESNGTISELEWTPSIILSCIDCLNPIATIYQNEQIEVLVIYDDGCEERLAINLIYEEEATVTLPNIFTPNRDGYNDMFYLSHYDENALITEFYVFDRWGSKVFSAENVPANKPEFGWDGKFNEKEAAQGVYVYYIAVEQLNVSQPTIYAGDVTLIR
jgi:gliding motility-associated-like protein